MQELKKFIEEITIDFDWILYEAVYNVSIYDNEPSRVNFPFCCQLSAQLIASFLYAHYSKNAKCIRASQNCPEHFWCECDDMIIDFTDFQFFIGNEYKEKFNKYSWKKSDFEEYISRFPVIYSRSNHSHTTMIGIEIEEMDLLAVPVALKYEFSKNGFCKYVKEAIQIVQPKLKYI